MNPHHVAVERVSDTKVGIGLQYDLVMTGCARIREILWRNPGRRICVRQNIVTAMTRGASRSVGIARSAAMCRARKDLANIIMTFTTVDPLQRCCVGKIRDRLQILMAGHAGEPAVHRGINIRLCHNQRNRIAVFGNLGQRRIGVAGQTCFIGVLRRHRGATAQEHHSEHQQDALHEFGLTSLFVPRPKFPG